ncbi:MAG: ATP-dependent Clp protease adaptor ClpS [Steroidobacteraceae bacterium]
MSGADPDLSRRRFVVCIDEIKQNFVFGATFEGRYARTVTLSDGTTRTIELTPTIRDGRPVVELKDTGGCTYMGLNGTTTNGSLMIQIRDLDAMAREARLNPPDSPTLPPETSLLSRPELVPPGFTHGIEIFNDNATPMEFVTFVLASSLGLSLRDANRTMLEIHTRGGALLATPSLAEAQRIAALITAEAARQGHPLMCRPVSNQSVCSEAIAAAVSGCVDHPVEEIRPIGICREIVGGLEKTIFCEDVDQ